MVPRTAVVAMVEPLRLENTVPDSTARMLSRPGRRPNMRSITSTAWKATRECHRISPMRMNSGMGSRTNVETESYMLSVSEWNARPPPCRIRTPRVLTRMNPKATGTPSASTNIVPPRMIVSMSHHSMM